MSRDLSRPAALVRNMTAKDAPILLSSLQHAVLRTLVRRNGGVWAPGCGWMWQTPKGTAKILDTLVAEGLATRPGGAYTVTPLGRARALLPVSYLAEDHPHPREDNWEPRDVYRHLLFGHGARVGTAPTEEVLADAHRLAHGIPAAVEPLSR